jgi:hypothetical protein
MTLTLAEYTRQYKQEATHLEAKIAQLTCCSWNQTNVLEILEPASNDAIQHIAVEHAKFAGMFTAGKQLADWCFAELNRRRRSPDYQLTVSEMMFGKR